jgi:DNA-binding NtrC family response regulator
MLSRRHEESGGSGAVRIAREAIDLLTSVHWPGNLRQLDNILRRAYAISLSDRGGAGNDLVLARRHVERALAYDAAPETGALIEQLWRAASAFVQEAERREPSAGPLSLDMIEVLRGLVLAAAVQRRGRDDAFVLLGQQQLLKNRNHHRALKRELERVREFLRLVGGDVDPELAAALDAAEESGEGR